KKGKESSILDAPSKEACPRPTFKRLRTRTHSLNSVIRKTPFLRPNPGFENFGIQQDFETSITKRIPTIPYL
ncbi:14607_t:CDS:1, partial [Gigaspora rosea]